MKSLFAVMLVAACFIALDLPSLVRSRRIGQLAVFITLWLAGIASTLCTVLKVPTGSPLSFIIWLYTPVNDFLSGCLVEEATPLKNLAASAGRILKRDVHAAGAAPSDGENGPHRPGLFSRESAIVVFCTTKTGKCPAFAAQCCTTCNISGGFPCFAANFAQNVAQNTTFPVH